MNKDEQITAPVQTDVTRICSNPHCEFAGQPQPLDEKHFAPDRRYSGDFRTECRRCESERAKTYNKAHQDKGTKNRRKWARKNKEHVNAYQRDRYGKMAAAYKQVQQPQTA